MDEKLRGLGRSSDDPEQEARYLRSALRAGELSSEDVRLAAHLGDSAARRAVDWIDSTPSLHAWIMGFRAFGQVTFVRMHCAALRSATPSDAPRKAALERILGACEAWADDPTPTRQQLVEEVISQRLTPSVQETFALRQNPAAWEIVTAAQTAAANTRADWKPDVEIPTWVDPNHPDAERLLSRLSNAGACLDWVQHDDTWTAVLADCGYLGAGGVAKALGPVSPLKPMEILGIARPFRERAAPALFATRLAGEDTVRKAIRAALLPKLGG